MEVGSSVKVIITREPFSDFFVLLLDSGHTEELEVEETRAWFRERGADMHKLEPVLDEVWNFGHSVVTIDNFKLPVVKHPAFEPQV